MSDQGDPPDTSPPPAGAGWPMAAKVATVLGVMAVIVAGISFVGGGDDSSSQAETTTIHVATTPTELAEESTTTVGEVPSTSAAPPQTVIVVVTQPPPTPSTTRPPAAHRLTGEIRFQQEGGWYNVSQSTSCGGHGGFSDMNEGTSVVVRDGASVIIAQGVIDESHYEKVYQHNEGFGDGTRADWCLLHFTVEQVPETPHYQIRIGNRNDLTYTLDELRKANWDLRLTIKG